MVDLIGCEDTEKIIGEIKKLSSSQSEFHPNWVESSSEATAVHTSAVPIIQTKEPTKVSLDKAGYFVIIPQSAKGIITVEHYSYDNKLLRVIEGKDALSIYWTIIENGWVTQLSHAAYLGKELEKAFLSMHHGFRYIQEGAVKNKEIK